MPPVRMRGDGRKAKNPGKTLLRMLSYMKKYIPNLVLVLLCIVVTAVAQTRGSENLGTLVDDYILRHDSLFPAAVPDGSCDPGHPEDHP